MTTPTTDLLDELLSGANAAPEMTKRHINIDDAKLTALREHIGTKTITDTVDFALREVLALLRRRRWLIENRDIDYSLLADENYRRSLWERDR